MNKQPERTARTRQTMIDAFWELAAADGARGVTVNAVTRRAGLNRSTFYEYFTGMDDLTAQAEEEILGDMRTQVRQMIADGGVGGPDGAMRRIIRIFLFHEERLFLLLGPDGDPMFLTRIRQEATDVYRQDLKMDVDDARSEYVIAYATSAFVGILRYWRETGETISVEELAGLVYTIASKGLWAAAGIPVPAHLS